MEDELEYRDEEIPELTSNIDLVPVTPEKDSTVTLLIERGRKALDYAEKFIVSNQGEVGKAIQDLSLIKGLKDKLEDKRKEYVNPLNEKVKSINNFFKAVSESILKADKILRDKVLAFNASIDRQRREAEARESEKLRLAQEQAKANNGEISVDLTPEIVPELIKTVKTDIGSATTSGTWKYNVTDFTKVPDTYKIINASVVNAFVKSNKGKVEIPGIVQYFEPSLVVRNK
jgi:hypothetical protein